MYSIMILGVLWSLSIVTVRNDILVSFSTYLYLSKKKRVLAVGKTVVNDGVIRTPKPVIFNIVI